MLLQSVLSILCLVGVVSAKHHPTVYLIRHGEKPEDKRDPGLNREGEMRAQCLRHVFGKNSGHNIGHIMAPRVKKGGARGRSLYTVLPLADDLGLTVDTSCERNDVECVVDAVHSHKRPGDILIVWRHGDMGDIVEALGATEQIEYPKKRFDLIWTDPWPYGKVVDITSEACPILDVSSGLVDQF